MKSMILILLSLCLFSSLFAEDFVVIVNKGNSLESVPKAMLKRYYIGRATEIDGKKVVPINFTLDSPVGTAFLDAIVGKSPAEYKEYWVAQQIKGAGSAPMVQSAVPAIIGMVTNIPGAIAYVPAGQATDAVKVITVK